MSGRKWHLPFSHSPTPTHIHTTPPGSSGALFPRQALGEGGCFLVRGASEKGSVGAWGHDTLEGREAQLWAGGALEMWLQRAPLALGGGERCPSATEWDLRLALCQFLSMPGVVVSLGTGSSLPLLPPHPPPERLPFNPEESIPRARCPSILLEGKGQGDTYGNPSQPVQTAWQEKHKELPRTPFRELGCQHS